MRSKNDDIRFGTIAEVDVMAKIKDYFQYEDDTNEDDIKSTKEKGLGDYCRWDYESADGSRWEVKTRRNKRNAYPTTIIGFDKVVKNLPYRQMYIFNFIDGCCYIEYDEEVWKDFDTSMRKPNYRSGDNYRVATKHYEIPIELLTPMVVVI